MSSRHCTSLEAISQLLALGRFSWEGRSELVLCGCHHPSSASTDLVPLVLSFQLTQCSSGMRPPCNWWGGGIRFPFQDYPVSPSATLCCFYALFQVYPNRVILQVLLPWFSLMSEWTIIYSTNQEGISLREKPPKGASSPLEGLCVCVCVCVCVLGWGRVGAGQVTQNLANVGYLSDQ